MLKSKGRSRQEQRRRRAAQTLDTTGEGEGETDERATLEHVHGHAQHSWLTGSCCATRAQPRALPHPEGWEAGGGSRGSGHMYNPG